MKKLLGSLTIVSLLGLGHCRVVGVCVDKASCNRDDSTKDIGVNEAKDCANTSFVGQWGGGSNDSLETLKFYPNCKFESLRCGVKGEFSKNADRSGRTDLENLVMPFEAVKTGCPEKLSELDCEYIKIGLTRLEFVCIDAANKSYFKTLTYSYIKDLD